MEVKNKVVFITGGASGIGLATAKKFLKEGAKVVIFSRQARRAEKDLKGENTLILEGDVTKRGEVKKSIEESIKKFGQIDILINNAGVAKEDEFIVSKEEDWDYMWNVNVKGVFIVTQEVLGVMSEGRDKVIVNIASGAGIYGIAELAAYSATKAAVINFTQSLNEELEGKIRVVTVAPGSTDTEMFRSLWPNVRARHKPEQVADVIYKTVIGEIKPDERLIVDVFHHAR